jgi:hypothetical protein
MRWLLRRDHSAGGRSVDVQRGRDVIVCVCHAHRDSRVCRATPCCGRGQPNRRRDQRSVDGRLGLRLSRTRRRAVAPSTRLEGVHGYKERLRARGLVLVRERRLGCPILRLRQPSAHGRHRYRPSTHWRHRCRLSRARAVPRRRILLPLWVLVRPRTRVYTSSAGLILGLRFDAWVFVSPIVSMHGRAVCRRVHGVPRIPSL